jgi:hypothetical protein
MSTLLAVLTGGGLATVGGLLSGWLNNWLGSQRDERAHAREQQMTREALSQERLERTYTELGLYVARFADWARVIQPFGGLVPAPEPMTHEERSRIEALVMNHGSPEVRQLLEHWRQQARRLEIADAVIRASAEMPDGRGLADKAEKERQALPDYRKAMHEAAATIQDQMRAELAGQERGEHPAG